jgi:hypothetical protein
MLSSPPEVHQVSHLSERAPKEEQAERHRVAVRTHYRKYVATLHSSHKLSSTQKKCFDYSREKAGSNGTEKVGGHILIWCSVINWLR